MKQESLPRDDSLLEKSSANNWIDKSSSVVKAETNSLVTLYINPALKLGCMFGYIYTPSNTSSWTNAFTLPTGAKPNSTLFFHAGPDTNMQIGSSGSALYIGASNQAYKYFNAVYPLA